MRTLALLAALLLLAFPARAQALQETAEQVPAQDQPGAEDQDLYGGEDQDLAVPFPGEERFTRHIIGFDKLRKLAKFTKKILRKVFAFFRRAKRRSCRCRPQNQCPQHKVNRALKRFSWVCRIFGRQYRLCCN